MEFRAENLEYIYSPGTRTAIHAIRGVDFTIPSGSFVGIIGRTGCGKTTLAKLLNGLYRPSKGRILVNGKDAGEYGADLRRKVGLVFQRPERQIFGRTVYEDLSFVLKTLDYSENEIDERIGRACSSIGFSIAKNRDKNPHSLTDTDRRKLAIAGVLANEPHALILDEPAVGLDAWSISELLVFLTYLKSSRNKTVIIVSHDMEPFLPVLDSLMAMKTGRIEASGSPSDVCVRLRSDPEFTEMLPQLVLLIQDLRQQGYSIPENEFRTRALLDILAGDKN